MLWQIAGQRRLVYPPLAVRDAKLHEQGDKSMFHDAACLEGTRARVSAVAPSRRQDGLLWDRQGGSSTQHASARSLVQTSKAT